MHMDTLLLSLKRMLAVLAMAGSLLAVDPKTPMAAAHFNILLWEAGKAPLGRVGVGAAKAADPAAADPLDRVGSRPDFLVLVYGPGRATPGEQLKNFPPTFLLSAAADRGSANGNAQMFMDMNRAGAVVE